MQRLQERCRDTPTNGLSRGYDPRDAHPEMRAFCAYPQTRQFLEQGSPKVDLPEGSLLQKSSCFSTGAAQTGYPLQHSGVGGRSVANKEVASQDSRIQKHAGRASGARRRSLEPSLRVVHSGRFTGHAISGWGIRQLECRLILHALQ